MQRQSTYAAARQDDLSSFQCRSILGAFGAVDDEVLFAAPVLLAARLGLRGADALGGAEDSTEAADEGDHSEHHLGYYAGLRLEAGRELGLRRGCGDVRAPGALRKVTKLEL